MAVKVRERRGAWWIFVDHQGKRKARRVGVGKDAKKSADLAAIKIRARLAVGGKGPPLATSRIALPPLARRQASTVSAKRKRAQGTKLSQRLLRHSHRATSPRIIPRSRH